MIWILDLCKTVVFYFITYLIVAEFISAFIPLLPSQDWLRIKRRLNTANTLITKDTLYLGDGVASQFLPYNKNNILTSTSAIYPIGNYYLAKAALKKNPNIKCVIYYTIPDAVKLDMRNKKTHAYFVKPFLDSNNYSEILADSITREILLSNPTLLFNISKGISMVKMNQYDYYKAGYENKSAKFSESSIIWLNKLDSLINSHNATFALRSPPIVKPKNTKQYFSGLLDQAQKEEMEHIIGPYINSIQYWDPELSTDRIHWKKEEVIQRKRAVISYLHSSID